MGREKSVFLLMIVFATGAAYSQDYVIKHDLISDKTAYYRISKPADTAVVKNILMKKQGKLTLFVDNYNPFYWRAKVSPVKSDDQGTTAGLFNPISVLSNTLGDIFKELIPGLDIKGLIARGDARNEKGNAGYIYWASNYQEMYKRMRKLYSISSELALIKARLTELKYNITKPWKEIKQNASSAMNSVTGINSSDFEEVLKQARSWNHEFINLEDSLAILYDKLSQLAPGTDRNSLVEKNTTIGKAIDKIKETDSIYRTNNKVPDFYKALSEVANINKEIQSANYSYSYTVNNAVEYTQLKLQLCSRKDSANGDTVTKYFPIRAKGSLRMRNSVGIAFSYFADKNRRYYVKADTTIGSGRGDYFTPVISTFIHFYPYSTANFKLGGSLGFGIPITGDKKDINFMLGICGIIGKNEPIMISIGVTGAKVTQLDKGWQVGNRAPDINFTVPTADVFRAGIFLGISFNLGRMTVSKNDN